MNQTDTRHGRPAKAWLGALAGLLAAGALLTACGSASKAEADAASNATRPRANATVRQAMYVEAAAPPPSAASGVLGVTGASPGASAGGASTTQAGQLSGAQAASAKASSARNAKTPAPVTARDRRPVAVRAAASAAANRQAAIEAQQRAALAASIPVPVGHRYTYIVELDAGGMRTLRFEKDQSLQVNDRVQVEGETLTLVR